MSTSAVDPRWARHALAVVFLLSATSGIVDAVAFLRYHVFVANQTGNLVIVALSFVDTYLADARIPSLVGLVAFTVGVFLTVWLRNRLSAAGMADYRIRQWLLAGESVLILIPAVMAWRGLDLTYSLLSIALLSVSQAIQGVVITRFVGIAVQTVVINNAVIAAAEEAGRKDYRAAIVSSSTLVGYAAGAAVGALLLNVATGLPLGAAVLAAFLAALIVRRARQQGGSVN